MKSITLTQGKTALVDDGDYSQINQRKWKAKKGRNGNWYAERQNGHGKFITMHRLIMNAPLGVIVDHINGNGLDNRRENLRLCTNAQNLMNRGAQRNNTTGYKGVTWDRREKVKKYCAQIKFHKKTLRLGYFKTPEEAARVYDAKARELFGEFAVLNFPK